MLAKKVDLKLDVLTFKNNVLVLCVVVLVQLLESFFFLNEMDYPCPVRI